jgi:hypothetical protein
MIDRAPRAACIIAMLALAICRSASAQEISDKARKSEIVTSARQRLFGLHALPKGGFACRLRSEWFNILGTGRTRGLDGADTLGIPLGFSMTFNGTGPYCRPDLVKLRVTDDSLTSAAASVAKHANMIFTYLLTLDEIALPKGSEPYRVSTNGDEYLVSFVSSGNRVATRLSHELEIAEVRIAMPNRAQLTLEPLFQDSPRGLAVESIKIDISRNDIHGSMTVDVKNKTVEGYPLPARIDVTGENALMLEAGAGSDSIEDRLTVDDYTFGR